MCTIKQKFFIIKIYYYKGYVISAQTLEIFQALGGLGIFLLGIIIMIDALKAFAGQTVHKYLIRFTNSPYRGALTGTISTAILQSSSATTVAAVGFVSAGLLSFSEALGIIFGANVGTTITGWLVLLFGFKFKLGTFAYVFVFVGVILKLLFKDNLSKIGLILAGFGLIFIGISDMQEGMKGFREIISFETFPADTIMGRLQLVAIGMIFTVITQSSSAGVAAALTALFSGLINFEQAAALVIGMDIGTTIKAIIATIGGSTNTVRTGFSHTIYNIFTAVMALFLITPFVYVFEFFSPGFIYTNSEVALVAFHTMFNFLGLVLVLPFTKQFADLMIRLIPQKYESSLKALEPRLLKEPIVAVQTLQNVISIEMVKLLGAVNSKLQFHKDKEISFVQVQNNLDEIHRYIDALNLNEKQNENSLHKYIQIIHLMDHLSRLTHRVSKLDIIDDPKINELAQKIVHNNIEILTFLEAKKLDDASHLAKKSSRDIKDIVNEYRKKISHKMAVDDITIVEGRKKFEILKDIQRIGYHLDKSMSHYKKVYLS